MSTTEGVAPVDEGQDVAEPPAIAGLMAGTWVEGRGDVKEIRNPATGAVVSTMRSFTSAQVDEAIAAAKKAQKPWAALPIADRAKLLHAGVDAIEDRGEEIARWMTVEMGKTIREAREEILTDIVVPLGHQIVEDGLRLEGRVLQPARADYYPGRRVMVIHQPIGVTGFISPWNFPAEMIINCIAAMMVGNTCVWKPSEWAPYGPQILTEAFVSAGVPPGVLNLIYGGPDVGDHLVRHDDVGLIGFIGSTATGEKIASAAGVKRLLLELGGNGPLVVLEDADLDKAVETAAGDCFYQAGQVCTAAERVLVHEQVHDELVARLAARVAELKVGDPLDESTDMGPLSDERILSKVVRHVTDATAKGATLITGGGHEGQFFEPTILTGVTPDMAIAQEETFGPVAPIMKIEGAEQAIEIANSLEYGLSMAVFTNSLQTAWQMAEQLEADRST